MMRPKSLQELKLETEKLCQQAELTLLAGEQILSQIKETNQWVAVLVHSMCAEVEQALFLEGAGALVNEPMKPCRERNNFGPVTIPRPKLGTYGDEGANQACCSTEGQSHSALCFDLAFLGDEMA